jgi:RNA-directed DNA polymerase
MGWSSRHRPRCREFLGGLRAELKARRFTPTRVREKAIPKASGKLRRLGIPTAADRVVQAALKLVLEPIFEADFKPCSYGFRPRRRAQDAIAEIHFLGTPGRNYQWVFEADIKACFDEIDHTALMGRMRDRIGDRRVLGLVKAFLRAGILSEEGLDRQTITGTPKAASSHRCWPTSPWPCWTSTSPASGKRSDRNGSVSSIAAPAVRS